MRRVERRFRCTACGKCCCGSLPLTLGDALRHAHRFPLAFVWTAVPQSARVYSLVARLGTPIRLPQRGKVAVLIAPTAYLPPSFPCPELAGDGSCGIHAIKPARCRTMPFYPYREERDQDDLLEPREGWECDTSAAAPVVYRDHAIVERDDFDRERAALLAEAPTMRTYTAYVVKYMPWVIEYLDAAVRDRNGRVVTSLSSFLTATRNSDKARIAQQQVPVLTALRESTAGSPDLSTYHREYCGWLTEMQYLAGSIPT